MVRTEAMKLLAFKFQEEKCVVLGEANQVARGAPRTHPGWETWAYVQAAGGWGGQPQAESQPGRFSSGAAGPLKYSVVKQHTSQLSGQPRPTPMLCIVTDRLVISPNSHEKPGNP